MLFPSHFLLYPVRHVFLSIIKTSSNRVKVSKRDQTKDDRETDDLELNKNRLHFPAASMLFHVPTLALCTLNFFCLKFKGIYTNRCTCMNLLQGYTTEYFHSHVVSIRTSFFTKRKYMYKLPFSTTQAKAFHTTMWRHQILKKSDSCSKSMSPTHKYTQ